ncbi:hypothetical protein M8C21_007299 [Ambrosia artemisiifolia]|uniref:DNA mismatch repair protein Mlh1 C-terminal domain-containing protein n=1 Tax=Ambrosia artemisiifolia TaxID=4212 RepID=A0AAD5CPJ2_AMBAR|nr:hypothetical protein M8C21_007299 [Ambrosia artemisiifolia]
MDLETTEPPPHPMETDTVHPPQPQNPPRIHRLDESVVNRIAAGEDGGLKFIQVSDDGHGIRYEDLPILCERHTTSKLSAFEDLQSIKSMGFRGEALASMTYVAHVTVTTITSGQLHGYRVSYRDGVMEHEPRACAAVKGTQIVIENLFYNMIARRKSLQSSADDYPKIVDLLSRFAIHHKNVSFSCKKHGASKADVHSVAMSSRLDAIRSVYGASVARNLIEIEASDVNSSSSVFEMNGYISDSNYSAKKTTMILFINGLLDIVRNCTYVGMADDVFALLQHNTNLYLANVVNLSKELMYQLVLQRFGYFNAIQLSDPAPLHELIMLALREEDPDSEGTENDDLKEKIAEMNVKLLTQKTEMLDEYFGIHVDPEGNLSRLPVILDQHTPDMDRVPEFALCLGNDVVWNDEKICFQTIAAALGNFYAMHPPLLPNPSADNSDSYKRGVEGVDDELISEAENAWAQREWSIQHVLFPSMRLFFKPPTSMAANGTFVQL